MKQILFIGPTRIGDAVLASAILAHILAKSPDAQVTIATSPLATPLYEGFPLLEHIIPMVKQTYNRHWLKLWREVGTRRWDEVWDVRGSIVGHLLCTRALHSFVPPKNGAPKVEQYAQAFGTGPLPYPTLWPREADSRSAQRLLPDGQRFLAFAPTANWAPKEWPVRHFIALAQELLTGACAGYRPIIIAAGHERERALPLLEALASYQPIDLTNGELSLLEIYACLQRAHGFVGNDSGLMHMAAAAGISTLGIFGPTPSAIYQPWGNHAGFIASTDGTMASITPSMVAKRFSQLA
jgi:lipopolysaccharide export system permease protein